MLESVGVSDHSLVGLRRSHRHDPSEPFPPRPIPPHPTLSHPSLSHLFPNQSRELHNLRIAHLCLIAPDAAVPSQLERVQLETQQELRQNREELSSVRQVGPAGGVIT